MSGDEVDVEEEIITKSLRDVALVAGLACMLGLLSLLVSQLYISPGAKAATQNLTVTTKLTQSTKATKVSLGAQFINLFDVLDTSGKLLGKLVNSCVIAGVDQSLTQKTDSKCDAILQLPDGTIDLGRLLVNETTPGAMNAMAVLGGTGKYTAVSGAATLKNTSNTESQMTINFAG